MVIQGYSESHNVSRFVKGLSILNLRFDLVEDKTVNGNFLETNFDAILLAARIFSVHMRRGLAMPALS